MKQKLDTTYKIRVNKKVLKNWKMFAKAYKEPLSALIRWAMNDFDDAREHDRLYKKLGHEVVFQSSDNPDD